MIISLITAMTSDRVIGIKNVIPWYLSADLAWFKLNTIGKPIIMGNRTFKSIGKPLTGRKNIVLSSIHHNGNENVIWVSTPEQALAAAISDTIEEVMVIGGGKVYEAFLPQARRLYLTHVNTKLDGDTWFPDYKPNEWQSTFRKFHNQDEKNNYSCCFEILDRYI